MKTLSLDIEPDYDFNLIGICCHCKDFRLCWEINQCLSLDFERKDDFKLYDKKVEKRFPFFNYEDEGNALQYSLIKNRAAKGVLIPEEKKVDYFLIIKGQIEGHKIDEICKQLRGRSIILTVYPIAVKTLKSKQNLIF